jgi:ABC-type lipoprotein release transport system permease subunit
MEKKYDKFFKEHGDVKAAVKAMAEKKKTIKDLFKQAGMIIATIGVVTGIVLGILRYSNSKRPALDTVKIEKMLEKLIDKD